MMMDYNKWGIVTGITSLIFLLAGPIFFVLSVLWNNELVGFYSSLAGYYLRYVSILLGIITIVFGILSLKAGNKKKTALILGITSLVLLILLIGYSLFMSMRMAEIIAEKEADPEFQSWQQCRKVYSECISEGMEGCRRAGQTGIGCTINTLPCVERERECKSLGANSYTSPPPIDIN